MPSKPLGDDELGELSRREFLAGLTVAAGALAIGGCGDSDGKPAATATPRATPSLTASASPTATNSPAATSTATPSPSETPSQTATPSETPSQTATSTETPSETPTETPTQTATPTDPESDPLPSPASSGIKHIVVVMMENRSFDHFLGWLPGADGRQAGLAFTDKQGAGQRTFPLAPNFQNCQFGDPDHSYAGGRTQFNGGAAGGWLRASTDDNFPIGYYTQDDLAFYGSAVPAWTTVDRYFAAILGPTFPNRFYMHAAQTDRLTNTLTQSTLPTIWDRLADQGLTGKYYYSDLPVTALWGDRFTPISKPIATFFDDARAGNLANVTYIDPRFLGEDEGTSNDDRT
ncbi:MAG: alkaline phosphatase family protein [bacterium]